MFTFGFEKLEVWQDARKLTILVYQLTEKFPEKEKFGLSNQMRRASVSVGANIAEGSTRFSSKEQAHFYSISYGSLMELMSHTYTSFDLQYINIESFEKLRDITYSLSIKINNLRNVALLKSNKK